MPTAMPSVQRFIQNLAIGENILRQIHPEDADVFELLRTLAPSRVERTVTVEIRWVPTPTAGRSCLQPSAGRTTARSGSCSPATKATVARRSEAQMRRVVEGSAQGINRAHADRSPLHEQLLRAARGLRVGA